MTKKRKISMWNLSSWLLKILKKLISLDPFSIQRQLLLVVLFRLVRLLFEVGLYSRKCDSQVILYVFNVSFHSSLSIKNQIGRRAYMPLPRPNRLAHGPRTNMVKLSNVFVVYLYLNKYKRITSEYDLNFWFLELFSPDVFNWN